MLRGIYRCICSRAPADAAGSLERSASRSTIPHEMTQVRDSSVSMGRGVIVVNDADAHVAVPLVRVGSSEREVTVTLSTVDNLEGTGCRRNREFGAIRTRVGAHEPMYPERGGLKQGGVEDGRSVSITFPAGSRLAFVYVELLRKPTLQTLDPGCAEFTVQLTSASNNTATGPVHESVVRIVSAEHFPNGFRGFTLSAVEGSQTSLDKLVDLKREAAESAAFNLDEAAALTDGVDMEELFQASSKRARIATGRDAAGGLHARRTA